MKIANTEPQPRERRNEAIDQPLSPRSVTTKQTSPTPEKHLCVALVMRLLPLDLLGVLLGSNKDSGESSSVVRDVWRRRIASWTGRRRDRQQQQTKGRDA